MKQAVSVSLGSSSRDKDIVVELKGQRIRLEGREYPLYAALDLIREVKRTPVVDGRGLKHTLERRLFELAGPELRPPPSFGCALVPLALDRVGLLKAISEVCARVVCGDLMFALGIPMPLVSRFPMSLIFYGSDRIEFNPKFPKYWKAADLIAGDMLFIRKYSIEDLNGKTVITNTTTPDNIELLRARGVSTVITTTPRYEGRTFGTNMIEAALTAYAGKARPLSEAELNALIDELELRPTVLRLQ